MEPKNQQPASPAQNRAEVLATVPARARDLKAAMLGRMEVRAASIDELEAALGLAPDNDDKGHK